MKSNTFLSLVVVVVATSLVARPSRAADYPPGMDWHRQQDYREGAEEGEASMPSEESPWSYAWGKADAEHWAAESATPLAWQPTWFEHPPACWAREKDRLPMVFKKSICIALNSPKSLAVCYLRWRNPQSKAISTKVSGTLKLVWHGGDPGRSSDFPLHVVAFIQSADGSQSPFLFDQIISDSGSEVAIDLNDVKLSAGDDIVFGFKPEVAGGEGYVSVDDDLTIQLVTVAR